MGKHRAAKANTPPFPLRLEEEYNQVRAAAQSKANGDGFDYGIEQDPYFKSFRHFMLPRRENRNGHELRCEVVSCELLVKCQPGHGPC